MSNAHTVTCSGLLVDLGMTSPLKGKKKEKKKRKAKKQTREKVSV
uniref:Uncharacterized protein n=1 Tax=Anguilla anguilla TaxID=7936 RepID=A0A0E9PBL8_ANGAN